MIEGEIVIDGVILGVGVLVGVILGVGKGDVLNDITCNDFSKLSKLPIFVFVILIKLAFLA